MIVGLGTDIVSIDRINNALTRHGRQFAEKILTENELEQFDRLKQNHKYLAKRFAVKEAASKALGTGMSEGITWHNITLKHDLHGKPLLCLAGKAQERADMLGATRLLITLSDEKHYAVAFVVLES